MAFYTKFTCKILLHFDEKDEKIKKDWTDSHWVAIIRFTTKKEVMQELDVVQASDLVLLVIMGTAVILDFMTTKISNRLILVGLILALVFHFMDGGMSGILYVLWNISFPVIVLYLFYLTGALGAGDIKLFSVVGGFLNFKELLWCILFSFVTAAVMSLVKMLYFRTFALRMRKGLCYIGGLLQGKWEVYQRNQNEKKDIIHFSLAILLGTIAARLYMGGM